MALTAGQDDVLISAAGRDHVLTLTAGHDNVLTLIPEREWPGAEELPELGAGDPEVERLHRQNAPDHLDHSVHDFSNHCELINWNEQLLIN